MAKKISFEDNLNKLEEMVKSLETGDLTLDQSLKNFEVGVKLYTDCKDYLGDVEKKISFLTDSLEEKTIE